MVSLVEFILIRVLVISTEQPLWAGVKSILGKESNLDLISLPVGDNESLLQMIEYVKPAVIVVDEKFPMQELAMVLDLRRTYAELRVIVISLRENRLQIYDKKDVLVSGLGDFIQAVHSNC